MRWFVARAKQGEVVAAADKPVRQQGGARTGPEPSLLGEDRKRSDDAAGGPDRRPSVVEVANRTVFYLQASRPGRLQHSLAAMLGSQAVGSGGIPLGK